MRIDHLKIHSKIILDKPAKFPSVCRIGQCFLNPRVFQGKGHQQGISGFGIVNIGRSYLSTKNITILVSGDMTLDSLDFLVPVNALFRGRKCRLHALAVTRASEGTGDWPL